MNLGPGTKPGKRNKRQLKKSDDDIISENFDVIVIFLIYDQFEAKLKMDSRCIVCKICIFINSNFLPGKTRKQNYKIYKTVLTILFWVKGLFWPRNADILQNVLASAKLRQAWYWKVYFLKLNICVYFRAEFQVSSITLTSFRQLGRKRWWGRAVILPPPTLKQTPKKPT